MKIKIAIVFLVSLFSKSEVYAAKIQQINCHKSVSKVEKMICKDSDLSKLDKTMRANYLAMQSSNIGYGAKKELQINDKKWVLRRNECAKVKCVEDSYKTRIKEICKYPVIDGVYPVCEIVY